MIAWDGTCSNLSKGIGESGLGGEHLTQTLFCFVFLFLFFHRKGKEKERLIQLLLVYEQAHLRVTRVSGEEQSDPAARSLVMSSRLRRSISRSRLCRAPRALVLQREPARKLIQESSACSPDIWQPLQFQTTAEINVLVNSEFSARRPWSWAAISSSLQDFIHKSWKEEQSECIRKIIYIKEEVLAMISMRIGINSESVKNICSWPVIVGSRLEYICCNVYSRTTQTFDHIR